jgi:Tol biopolymer transport system component
MPLTAGAALGPYEILAPLGAGGMGEVYKARDQRLGRTVAIKVLPAHVAHVPEARARFEREARTVSALSHPHICTLHDIGSQDGVEYMVMEFVEGESLAERVKKGPLPVEEALTYAAQASDALDKAHRKGVVHRDVKPGNIMIGPAGVKVLDFGLAKGFKAPQPAVPASTPAPAKAGEPPPTASMPLTSAGSIVGTLQYMAPEQLEGQEADARTDIFAFGSVLYEILTGRRAFEGKSQVVLISAIMTATPPPVSSLQPLTPPALDALIRRCLEKDPEDRWQSMRDLHAQLQWIASSGSQAGIPAPVAARRKIRDRAWMGATAALALAYVALALWAGVFQAPPVEVGAVRFGVTPPEGLRFGARGNNNLHLAVSPDGRHLAFIAGESAQKEALWVRPIGSTSAQKLDRTDGADFPFWSPDSQWIAFAQDGKLRRIPVSGGSPLTIADAPAFEGGTWNRDGVIVFAPGARGPLHRVLAAGGISSPVTTLDQAAQEFEHSWPQFLAGGQQFLYLAESGAPGKTGIYVQTLGSNDRTFLLETPTRAAFAPPGHLLYLREGTLLAQNLDLGNLRLEGEPVAVAENVRSNADNGRNAFSVSGNGVLAYRAGGDAGDVQVSWYTRDGKRTGNALEPGRYGQIELSPDDKRLAVERFDEATRGSDLWLLEASGVFSRLTFGPESEEDPIWSPDSRRVAFGAQSKGAWEIHELVIGSGGETTVYADGKRNLLDDWSRDGKLLLFHDFGRGTPADGGAGGKKGGKGKVFGGGGPGGGGPETAVSVLPLTPGGGRKPEVVFQTPFRKDQFRLSPDGRWVAYMSVESGQAEIYVAAFPSFNDRQQVSSGGGAAPRWRRDGRELFYTSTEGLLMAAEVRIGPAVEIGRPKALFPVAGFSTNDYGYAVTGDGQKFLIRESAVTAGVEQLHVVVHWPAALGK